jgi:phenylalanine-4-hydroxylase
MLFERQFPYAQQYACQMYLEGHKKLELVPERLPDFAELNERFQDLVGWELVSTDIQYSSGQDWFEHLAKKEFLVTEYIRERDTLDYTPLPDIWHDTFGHLPMMANKAYADLVHEYAQLMLQFSKEDRKGLGSIWWYTIEFGLIRENGALKAFGAGLFSSYEELQVTFTDKMRKLPFNPATMAPVEPSPHHIHDKLWILDSFDQLREFVHEQLYLLEKV